ncbi:MAG: DUF2062 domain-containing protein [Cyanobacteriota bacterium]|nr:DUF2062 domain-containing protein [Cyanobacteriota bacterium]
MRRSFPETKPIRAPFEDCVAARRCAPQKPRGWSRRWRYYYYRLLRLQGTPDAIARGAASGVFAGFFPWFGFQIIVAVFLATAIRGNKLAAAATTWVSNPFTYVPIFAFNFKVGQWVSGWHEFSVSEIDWLSSDFGRFGASFFWTLLLGCAIVGFIAAFCSYCLSFWLVRRLPRTRRISRHK